MHLIAYLSSIVIYFHSEVLYNINFFSRVILIYFTTYIYQCLENLMTHLYRLVGCILLLNHLTKK